MNYKFDVVYKVGGRKATMILPSGSIDRAKLDAEFMQMHYGAHYTIKKVYSFDEKEVFYP